MSTTHPIVKEIDKLRKEYYIELRKQLVTKGWGKLLRQNHPPQIKSIVEKENHIITTYFTLENSDILAGSIITLPSGKILDDVIYSSFDSNFSNLCTFKEFWSSCTANNFSFIQYPKIGLLSPIQNHW